MSYSLYYTMLFTDQGMGNLVTISDDAAPTVVLFSALMDFGSSHSTLTGETVQFMKKYIDANRTNGKKIDLDLVVVSHQDNDHWSLFPKLLALYTGAASLKIGRMLYGGDPKNYSAGAKAAVSALLALAAVKDPLPTTQCTSYTPKGVVSLAEFPAANPVYRIVLVIGNVASASSAKDIGANTVSLLIGVQSLSDGEAFTEVLLPGDMTSETIAGLHKMQSDAIAKDLYGTAVLSLPHHGSNRTISDNYHADLTKRTFNAGAWFAKLVSADLLGISAGFASHRHPYESVIQMFAGTVASSDVKHKYVSYDEKQGKYIITDTYKQNYTNYSGIPDGVVTTMSQRTEPDKIVSIQDISHRVLVKISGSNITTYQLDVNSTPDPGLKR